MELELVRNWLENEMENVRPSGDGLWLRVNCPWCGHQDLSIRVEPDEGAPLSYSCFSATCAKRGRLTTDILREWGCIDQDTLTELARYNATVNPYLEKSFVVREKRDYRLVNLPRGNAMTKLRYIQDRLGVPLTLEQLKDFKIQLSILDLLRLNDIREIAASNSILKSIDLNCIGFVSIFDDYLICRNIAAKKGEMRYYNYRISGRKGEKNDLKIYCLPTEIDLMDPRAANINVAEGVFSLLGAYFHTDIGRDRRNNIFVANCGTMASGTVLRICKQYGLTKVRLNFFSDSEIPVSTYEKLAKELRSHLDIRSLVVWYCQADDFGHTKKDIGKIRSVDII